MATLFQFEIDVAALQKDLDSIGRAAPVVMARSVNKAGLAGQTAMVKAIGADTGISAKAIKREIRLDKATRTKPILVIEVVGKRIPLIEFGARGPVPSRGRGRGVTAKLPTGAGIYPHAFIATMPSGHRGVYQRRKIGRLPIRELFGPSIPGVFAKFIHIFETVASEALVRNLEHEISFEQSKRQPAAEEAA